MSNARRTLTESCPVKRMSKSKAKIRMKKTRKRKPREVKSYMTPMMSQLSLAQKRMMELSLSSDTKEVVIDEDVMDGVAVISDHVQRYGVALFKSPKCEDVDIEMTNEEFKNAQQMEKGDSVEGQPVMEKVEGREPSSEMKKMKAALTDALAPKIKQSKEIELNPVVGSNAEERKHSLNKLKVHQGTPSEQRKKRKISSAISKDSGKLCDVSRSLGNVSDQEAVGESVVPGEYRDAEHRALVASVDGKMTSSQRAELFSTDTSSKMRRLSLLKKWRIGFKWVDWIQALMVGLLILAPGCRSENTDKKPQQTFFVDLGAAQILNFTSNITNFDIFHRFLNGSYENVIISGGIYNERQSRFRLFVVKPLYELHVAGATKNDAGVYEFIEHISAGTTGRKFSMEVVVNNKSTDQEQPQQTFLVNLGAAQILNFTSSVTSFDIFHRFLNGSYEKVIISGGIYNERQSRFSLFVVKPLYELHVAGATKNDAGVYEFIEHISAGTTGRKFSMEVIVTDDTNANDSTTLPTPEMKKETNSNALIILTVVGVVIAAVACVGSVILYLKKFRGKKRADIVQLEMGLLDANQPPNNLPVNQPPNNLPFLLPYCRCAREQA